MLSGETASGNYPIEAVSMMDSIIAEAEKTPKERRSFEILTYRQLMLQQWLLLV